MLINAKCFTILDWWNNLHEMISIEFSTHLITCLKSSVHCLQDLYRDNTSTNNFNTQGHPVRFNRIVQKFNFFGPHGIICNLSHKLKETSRPLCYFPALNSSLIVNSGLTIGENIRARKRQVLGQNMYLFSGWSHVIDEFIKLNYFKKQQKLVLTFP